MVHCDNLPSVQALTSARAHNAVLAKCARAIWMLQAKYAIKISFSHIAGWDNHIADALSRAHTTKAYHQLASDLITTHNLTIVHPCTHVLSNLQPPVLSRCRMELVGGPSGGQAGTGPSTWNEGSIPINSIRAARLLPQVSGRPNEDDGDTRVPMGGIPGKSGYRPGYHQEQSLTRPRIYEARRGGPQRLQPRTCHQGTGRGLEKEGLCPRAQEGRDTSSGSESCPADNKPRPQWNNGQGGGPAHVLRRPAPVRGGAAQCESIQPIGASHKGRHTHGSPSDCANKSREESPEVRSAQNIYIIPHRRPRHVPNARTQSSIRVDSRAAFYSS